MRCEQLNHVERMMTMNLYSFTCDTTGWYEIISEFCINRCRQQKLIWKRSRVMFTRQVTGRHLRMRSLINPRLRLHEEPINFERIVKVSYITCVTNAYLPAFIIVFIYRLHINGIVRFGVTYMRCEIITICFVLLRLYSKTGKRGHLMAFIHP